MSPLPSPLSHSSEGTQKGQTIPQLQTLDTRSWNYDVNEELEPGPVEGRVDLYKKDGERSIDNDVIKWF